MHEIEVGGHRISFQLKRSSRNTLSIAVLPSGDTLVTAPHAAELEAIKGKLRKRAAWILDRQDDVSARPLATSPRLWVPGETHLFVGRQYRLRVDPNVMGTRRDGNYIIVGGVRPDEPKRVRNRLNRWYTSEGRRIFADRLDKCLKLFRSELLKRPALRIMPLEKRWGSYSGATNTLILNRRLIQAGMPEIDYVIVHELCHMKHPTHDDDFWMLLSRLMPDFRRRKDRLERLLL